MGALEQLIFLHCGIFASLEGVCVCWWGGGGGMGGEDGHQLLKMTDAWIVSLSSRSPPAS